MMFYLWTLLKLLTGFGFVLAYLNLSGRTQFSQMNAIDLIGNFILGGVIGGVLYTDAIAYHTYVAVLAMSILVLMGLNMLCRRFHLFRNVTIGRPIPIIRNGHFLVRNIEDQNNRVDILNVASQLNLQGIFSFDEVAYAQIEPNGSLTVTCDPNRIPAPIVICNGLIRETELEEVGQSREELLADMEKLGIPSPEDVLLAEYRYYPASPGVLHDSGASPMAGHFHYVCMNGDVLPHAAPERISPQSVAPATPFKSAGLPPYLKSSTEGPARAGATS
ncbi:DUF421 domain-containing protein [Oecophyllibacter saccharovorans]|uniref:DUF421 domain-containing protein n=1 Tax=Oecophyllibacter saccharovorans TaxID=2558360 RepID=UPI001142E77F|nr:YetF domain-containing protein [Oecophyllibacter saccharovorans]QDH15068.1 DUF421 domain-containing protein [Oecophyllibacter saccharovorans]